MRFITSKSNLAVALLFLVSPLHAEENGIEQAFQITTMPTGEKIIHWYGKLGRSYFLQVSDPNDHLNKWTWAQIIEGGNNEEISHEVDGTASKGFFRLKYTDRTPSPGFTLDTADFDGDGLSNLDEINPPPPFLPKDATDPLDPDTDKDGMTDGWEKLFAKNLLALGHPAAWWGARYAGLSSGNLNPDIDYTGDDITASELADLAALPSGQQPADGIHMIAQTKRNILGLSVLEPAHDTVPERIEGVYYYSNDGYPGAARAIDSRNQLEPQYLAEQVQLNPWATNATYSFSNFWVTAHGSRTRYNGEIRIQRQRIVALTPSASPVKRAFLKTLTRRNLLFGAEEIAQSELVELTIPSGKLSSDWIELIPPVVENRAHNLKFLPVEVTVDADRDGEITFNQKDKTTPEKPFKFWINDDVDRGNTVDSNDYEEDDLDENAKDSDDGKLNFRRDLEDLTRIWIDYLDTTSVFPPSDETVELKVRIDASSGTPVVNLYQPVETDGEREYLKDEAVGFNQLQGIYGQQLCQVTSSPIVVPRRAWETLPSDKVIHLLFEGAKEGEGKLIFEIWKDGVKMCDLPSVYLNLKKAKDMYETWTVGDVTASGVDFTKWPAASATQTSGQNLPAPEKPEEKDYIMFVHGWNMPPWEKETFASTMFKRMWHQGYKGRFGAFRWPTFHGLSGPSWGNLKGQNIHTAHFDGSEQRAWNSASALKNLLINRESEFGTNKIRLYAHSMGNVVSSEALRQMAPSSHVNTYISAQAAISSHVWDKTTPQMTFNAPFELNTPNVYGYYWQNSAALPPHNWENEGRPSYMDPQYMPSGTTYINHYNPLDWALSHDNWQLNQVLKPDVDYHYGWPALDFIDISLRFWKTQSIPPFRNLTFPNDRFEVFSYAAQSHGYATGQQGATAGKFNVAFSVNLRGEYGFESAHKGHSAQFRSTIQKRWTYWRRALRDMGITLPAL